MKDTKNVNFGEMLANGTVVKNITVDKRDIIELMKTKIKDKLNEEKKLLGQFKMVKEEEKDVIWKKMKEIIKKESEKQTNDVIETMNKSLKAFGFKQTVKLLDEAREYVHKELDKGKVIARIITDFDRKEEKNNGEEAGLRRIMMNWGWGWGRGSTEELMEDPICIIKKSVEITLPKEFLDLNNQCFALNKEISEYNEKFNNVTAQIYQVDNDAAKLTAILTEQVLDATVDGQKVLAMVNAMVDNQLKALPASQN